MLTKEETDFMEYWKKNRLKERSVWYQLKSGLYVGILFVIAILAMVFSGWYTRADMTMNSSGNVLTIIIALLIICVVYAIFHKRQQWDRKEQQYTELLIKKKKSRNF